MNMNSDTSTSFASAKHHRNMLASNSPIYNRHRVLQSLEAARRNGTIDGRSPIRPIHTSRIRISLIEVSLNRINETCNAVDRNLLLAGEPSNSLLLTLCEIRDQGHGNL